MGTRRRGKCEEREVERAEDEDCEEELLNVLAEKMKAEARKITIMMIDVLTEVCDIGAESDRYRCIAWQ